MPAEWFFVEHGAIVGPVSIAQLRELARDGRVQHTSSIRRAGEIIWKPAGSIKGLLDLQPCDTLSIGVVEDEPEGRTSRRLVLAAFSIFSIFAIVAVVLFVRHYSSTEQARIDSANTDIRQAVDRAEKWLRNGDAKEADEIEACLANAFSNKYVRDRANAYAVLQQVRTRRNVIFTDGILQEAKLCIDRGEVEAALDKLRTCMVDSNGTKKLEAIDLKKQVELDMSPSTALAVLVALPDEEFERFRQEKQLGRDALRYPALVKKWNAILISVLPEAKHIRDEQVRKAENDRIAERNRQDTEQLAKQERERIAREKERVRMAEIATPVVIETIKEMLGVHENPAKYQDRIVIVSPKIGWINPGQFERHQQTEGYLFSWHCGEKQGVPEYLGNKFGLFDDHLNYWCDTDAGLAIKKKLEDGFDHRTGMTLKITARESSEFGRSKIYYIAVLKTLSPP